MIRSCARRSFDAATIFIALVICCVFLTARIRRRRSISDGIVTDFEPEPRPNASVLFVLAFYAAAAFLAAKSLANSFTAASSARLQLIVELLLLGDAAEELADAASR